ncbi:GatB/YqeY domain-containing protein [Arthrobacter sp. GCM10027362]|uniref:GatB/YqeY domain-containing protein n=1 Tax=Arthrobacter sp. GCM10027362 TaxID=3273379 RepID=UPI0036315FBE
MLRRRRAAGAADQRGRDGPVLPGGPGRPGTQAKQLRIIRRVQRDARQILPQPLTAVEVEAIVDGLIATLKAGGVELGIRQMGAVMKPMTAKVAGHFDGQAVSEIVRARPAGQPPARRPRRQQSAGS